MKSAAQEGRKAKSIPPQLDEDRKTSRTGLNSLRPTEGFFFFNYFFLCVLLSFFLFLFPPFLPFLFYPFFLYSFIFFNFNFFNSFYCSFLLSFFIASSFLLSLVFSYFPIGETIKPGAMKRPELDRNGGHPKNRDRDNFQFATPENLKVGTVITSTPAGRGNPPTKKRPTDKKRRS